MAPLRAQILHLFRTLKTDRKVSYWYGARSKKEIFYEEDFREIEKQFLTSHSTSLSLTLSQRIVDRLYRLHPSQVVYG